MHRIAATARPPVVVFAVAVGLIAAFFAFSSAVASAKPPSRVVAKTARDAKLRKTVLVSTKGLTLYSLSAERRGRFICTNSFCLSLWTPLVVPKGTAPVASAGSAR